MGKTVVFLLALIAAVPLFGADRGVNRLDDTTMISQAQFQWTRIGTDWESVEPQKADSEADYHWGHIDGSVASAKRNGVKILFVIGGAAKWASSNGKVTGIPKDKVAQEHWQKVVRAIVKRYKDDVDYFEIWNEPDLAEFYEDSVENYINLYVKPAREEIKAVDPKKMVVGPTLSDLINKPRIPTTAFYKRLKAMNASPLFDIVSHHVYAEDPETLVNEFDKGQYQCLWILCVRTRASLFEIFDDAGFKDKPVILSEFGWRTDVFGERKQADYLLDTFQQLKRLPRVIQAYIYEFKDDDRYAPKWGIIKGNGTPKEAFERFRDTDFSKNTPTDPIDCTDDRPDWDRDTGKIIRPPRCESPQSQRSYFNSKPTPEDANRILGELGYSPEKTEEILNNKLQQQAARPEHPPITSVRP